MRLAKNEALIILGLILLLFALAMPAVAGNGWGAKGDCWWGGRNCYVPGQMPGTNLTAQELYRPERNQFLQDDTVSTDSVLSQYRSLPGARLTEHIQRVKRFTAEIDGLQ